MIVHSVSVVLYMPHQMSPEFDGETLVRGNTNGVFGFRNEIVKGME